MRQMDRVVHLAPGFGLGLSISSSRVYTYEHPRRECEGWHTGEGMLYLYNSDLTQFDDDFWPTVDPRRLPGTTVDVNQVREPASGQSEAPATTWVGGASLGAYGAAGMCQGLRGSTPRRKNHGSCSTRRLSAWGAVSAAAIPGRSRPSSKTARAGGGDNAFTVDGMRKSGTPGWSEDMRGVTWAHLAGRAEDADIGYFFPKPVRLHGLRETRSGVWNETTATVSRNFLTLWLSHGTNPVRETYSYVLLPGYSAAQVSDYAKRPGVEVLENSGGIQAQGATPLA